MDTVFDRILAGELPCYPVVENDDLLVIMDAYPVADGHCLILPKRRAVNVFDIDDASLVALNLMSKKLAIAVKRAMRADGIKIHQNSEAAAHQTVFYFHLHVIPAYAHGKWRGHAMIAGDAEVLTEHAQQIRVALDAL